MSKSKSATSVILMHSCIPGVAEPHGKNFVHPNQLSECAGSSGEELASWDRDIYLAEGEGGREGWENRFENETLGDTRE